MNAVVKEKNMDNNDHGGTQDRLEEHSLPGTNQAGTGPSACEERDQEERPRDHAPDQDQREEHRASGAGSSGETTR